MDLSLMQRGFAAVKTRNIAEAARWFAQALDENPGDVQAMTWLGQSLCNLGNREDGLPHLRRAAFAQLESARASGKLAPALEVIAQLQHWGDFSGTIDLLQVATDIGPTEFRAFQMLAASYAQLNRKAEALEAALKAMALAPDNAMMSVFLASLEADAGQTTEAKARLEAVLARDIPPREAFRAHKELARICDKLKVFDQVFPHLHAAARLAKALPEYVQQNVSMLPNMIAANRAGFTRELMGRWAATTFRAERPAPVFLMGFFRSGTTLTQEVLAAHPGVYVADEADFIWATQRELHRRDPSAASTADKLRKLDQAGIQGLRDFYWARVKGRLGDELDARLFVDKFTLNTVDLGLINCIFPDAKVLFVKRDPRDVCLSCFMQLMIPSPATVQLLDWERTARFFAQTMDWWSYIRNEMTMAVCELRYEDAVAKFEETFRQVFGFLGLEWDPGVTEFYKKAAQRAISTPSRNQVAQPLYASSVARWRHFEAEFASVAAVLKPHLADYPDESA